MTTDQWLAVMGIAVTLTTAVGVPAVGALVVMMFRFSKSQTRIEGHVAGFKEHKRECVEDRKELHTKVSAIELNLAKAKP